MIVPLLIVAFFIAGAIAVVHEVGKTATDYRAAPGLGENASWVEKGVGPTTPVTLILGSPLGPDTDRLIAWELEFFNRNPIDVRNWGGGMTVDGATGGITMGDGPPLERFVVTPSSHVLQGTTRATNTGWLLQEPARRLQLSVLSSGFYPDGWIAPDAWVDVFSSPDPTGRITLTASRAFAGSSIPGSLLVTTGAPAYATDGSSSIPTPSFSQTVAVSGEPVGLEIEQPTAVPFRIAFAATPPIAPAEFGAQDARQLGARVALRIGNAAISG